MATHHGNTHYYQSMMERSKHQSFEECTQDQRGKTTVPKGMQYMRVFKKCGSNIAPANKPD
jgi:hypothetical protein